MTFRIEEYTDHWPEQFIQQRQVLAQVFADTSVKLEHIGSTSVPGLCAKPIIDILLGARSLQDIEQHIAALHVAGYNYVPEHEDELPERRYFVRPASTTLRVNLHAVCEASTFWNDHLAFRDRLRSDTTLRSEYATLKRTLFLQHAGNRPAYTATKAPFIQRAIAYARSGA